MLCEVLQCNATIGPDLARPGFGWLNTIGLSFVLSLSDNGVQGD